MDIFDGGPIMQASRDMIRTSRESKVMELEVGDATGAQGIAARIDLKDYRATLIEGAVMGDARFMTTEANLEKLKLKRGDKARIWLRS